MTKAEQATFLAGILRSLQDHVDASIDRIPEHWDRIELREWLADSLRERHCGYSAQAFKLNPERRRAYRKDRSINNV